MSEISGFGGFGGFRSNLTFFVAILLIIHCCLGRGFGGGCR